MNESKMLDRLFEIDGARRTSSVSKGHVIRAPFFVHGVKSYKYIAGMPKMYTANKDNGFLFLDTRRAADFIKEFALADHEVVPA